MPFTKVTKTRSICINGDWDGVHYEFTLNEGQPLSEAENLLTEAVNKWENEARMKRLGSIGELPTVVEDRTQNEKTESKILSEIYSITDLKELDTYKLLVTTPLLEAAFNQQLKKLSA